MQLMLNALLNPQTKLKEVLDSARLGLQRVNMFTFDVGLSHV